MLCRNNQSKQYLYLTCANKEQYLVLQVIIQISRFLKEIPKELLEGYEEDLKDKEDNNSLKIQIMVGIWKANNRKSKNI